ncbi:MAG: hypothetical protein WCS31_18005 [Verrucomicrobiae bacterium]
MKLLVLILFPAAVATVLTHFIVGWTDIAAAVTSFAVCFFFVGGIEGVMFWLRGTVEK